VYGSDFTSGRRFGLRFALNATGCGRVHLTYGAFPIYRKFENQQTAKKFAQRPLLCNGKQKGQSQQVNTDPGDRENEG